MIDPIALEVARAKLDELFREMQSDDQSKSMERLATVSEPSLRDALDTCFASTEDK